MQESESEQRYYELPESRVKVLIQMLPELRDAIPDLMSYGTERKAFIDISRGEEILLWRLRGFSVPEEVRRLKGPAIEVAGPTEGRYDFLSFDTSTIPRRVYVSNLFPGAPTFNDDGLEGLQGRVDFQANALSMPCRDSSISIVLCSNFAPIEEQSAKKVDLARIIKEREQLFTRVLEEVWRILENQGLFIGQGITLDNLKRARELGLTICEYQIRKLTKFPGKKKSIYGAAIMQKPQK